MKRRPGPIPEEYLGCSRKCRDLGEHTAVWGECEKAPPPPCEHPAESIGWDQEKFYVACKDCGQEVTVESLAKQAQVAFVLGCRCESNYCQDTCEATGVSWTLDPAKILACLAAEQRAMTENHSLMVTFHQEEWPKLLEAAKSAEATPEHFVRRNAVRAMRRALDIRYLTPQESLE